MMTKKTVTIESALAEILANQLRRIEYNYNGALKGAKPEFLHDMRVAIRRARFALRLFAPFVDSEKCYKIRESLAALNSKSGAVRDLDISIGRLKILFIKHRLNPGIRNRIFSELLAQHKKARGYMLKVLTSSRYEDTIGSIDNFIKELKAIKSAPCKDKDMGKVLNKLTKEHLDKLAKWGNWNVKELSSGDLHKMRIDFKRARYLMEFYLLCKPPQKDIKKDIASFAFFQDILGKHQDALTVINKIKKVSEDIGLDSADVKKIIKSEKRRAKKNRAELGEKWKQFRDHLKILVVIIVPVMINLIFLQQATADERKDAGVSYDNVKNAIVGLGMSYNAQGLGDKAIVEFNKAIQMTPDDKTLYNYRGYAYVLARDPDRAIADYSKAIELDPSFADAYNNRGLVYDMDKSNHAKAIDDFSMALKAGGVSAEVYFNRGSAYAKMEKHAEAIEDYDRAIELEPGVGEIYYGRAVSYFEKGEYDKARKDAAKAQELGCEVHPAFLKKLQNTPK